MPTTLNDHATNEKNTYAAAIEVAQTDLRAAQGELRPAAQGAPPSKADALTSAQQQLKQKEDEIARKRHKLVTTTVPSQANQLVEEITAATIELSALQAAVLDAKAEVDRQSAAAAFAQARLGRATARLAEAERALAAANAASVARATLTAAIAGPLAGISQAATDLLASATFTSANDKLGGTQFPEALRELAQARYELWKGRLELSRARVDAAATALSSYADAQDGLAGDVTKARIEHQRAEAAVRWFAATARERFDRAQKAIERLGQGDALLTGREQSDALDASVLAAREAAQAKEVALVEAQEQLDAADAAVEDARTVARAASPGADAATIDAVAAVQAQLTARGPLAQAVADAQNDYSGAERATLRQWQAIVPPEAWKKVLNFLEARAQLTALAATNIDPTNSSSLQRKLSAAEGVYGDALAALAARDRTIAFYEDSAARTLALLEAARAEETGRLLSAVRGDAT